MPRVEILEQKGHRFLWIDDRLWMFDIPYEQSIQDDLAIRCHGEVLVAGYGLGVIQKSLTRNPNVASVTSIEILPEVVEAARKSYGELYGRVQIGDFYQLPPSPYDCVVGDIWADIHPEFLDDYVRFAEKAKQLVKPNGKIIAWGQEFFEFLIRESAKNLTSSSELSPNLLGIS